jgi:L-2,4-diaminobutyric acid acetyltransferase
MASDVRSEISVDLRTPTPQDAADLWWCVRDSGSLDLNSPYAYLLVCSDFADTSIVARDDEGLLGFVAAYRPPRDPDAVFVWQVAVAPRARGQGLGQRLLVSLLASDANRTARELTATVTPDNEASLALFRGVARRLGAGCRELERFPAALFPDDGDGGHLPEVELRIGPLPVR